jgi:hypothetical protein
MGARGRPVVRGPPSSKSPESTRARARRASGELRARAATQSKPRQKKPPRPSGFSRRNRLISHGVLPAASQAARRRGGQWGTPDGHGQHQAPDTWACGPMSCVRQWAVRHAIDMFVHGKHQAWRLAAGQVYRIPPRCWLGPAEQDARPPSLGWTSGCQVLQSAVPTTTPPSFNLRQWPCYCRHSLGSLLQ